jgi:hypothetical protein
MGQEDQKSPLMLNYAAPERSSPIHWPSAIAVFIILLGCDSIPRPAPGTGPIDLRDMLCGWPWPFWGYTPDRLAAAHGSDTYFSWHIFAGYTLFFLGVALSVGILVHRNYEQLLRYTALTRRILALIEGDHPDPPSEE